MSKVRTLLMILLLSILLGSVASADEPVRIPMKHGGLWGFLDEKGRWVIKPQFDSVDRFYDGVAVIWLHDKRGAIDLEGELLFLLPKAQHVSQFSEGLFAWTDQEGRRGTAKWGYMTLEGEIIVPSIYDIAGTHSEGLAFVQKDNKWGYVDTSGKLVIPLKFEGSIPGDFKGGMAAAPQGELCGYIDKKGAWVIQPKYTSCEDFSEDLAAVRKDERMGAIDRSGRVVIPFEYGFVASFSDGLAKVIVDGRHGFIDKDNQMVIPPRYSSAHGFSEGFAWVRDSGAHFIDTKGRRVFPVLTRTCCAALFHNGFITIGQGSDVVVLNRKGEVIYRATRDSP